MKETWTPRNGLIMATLAGSHLYGTSRPDSDLDIRGVCFPPRETVLGMQGFEQFQPRGRNAISYSQEHFDVRSDDVTIYSLQKFFALCLNANPNILELLFVSTDRPPTLSGSDTWVRIRKHRHLFLSTKIAYSFAGYAYSQLSRIRGHKRWLENPPLKPEPKDYGLVNTTSGGQVFESLSLKKRYDDALKEYQHYATWRKNRNPARAKLEELHGYDTKHAAHLYRLIDEAKELLTTGHLTLPLKREYRDRYLSIIGGGLAYEEVVAMGKSAKDQLLALEPTSPLPKRPDHAGADELLISLLETWVCKSAGG